MTNHRKSNTNQKKRRPLITNLLTLLTQSSLTECYQSTPPTAPQASQQSARNTSSPSIESKKDDIKTKTENHESASNPMRSHLADSIKSTTTPKGSLKIKTTSKPSPQKNKNIDLQKATGGSLALSSSSLKRDNNGDNAASIESTVSSKNGRNSSHKSIGKMSSLYDDSVTARTTTPPSLLVQGASLQTR